MNEDDFISISALQHYIYCPRQCALIHIEQAWAENIFTAQGRVLHEKAHSGSDESRPGVRITRSMPVVSQSLGLSGQCDVVEFHRDGTIVPVEYKRGKPKSHRADEVQLCAQTLCLEEMLQCTIAAGFLFYGERKRRTEVPMDPALRQLTRDIASQTHAMIAQRNTPSPIYEARKCGGCSLQELCLPRTDRMHREVQNWFESQLAE